MQLLLAWYIPTLALIDHCNISLTSITPMLQYILVWKYLTNPANEESVVQYWLP